MVLTRTLEILHFIFLLSILQEKVVLTYSWKWFTFNLCFEYLLLTSLWVRFRMWIFSCSDCKTNLRIYNDCKNIKNRKTLCLNVFPIELGKNSPQVILKRIPCIIFISKIDLDWVVTKIYRVQRIQRKIAAYFWNTKFFLLYTE